MWLYKGIYLRRVGDNQPGFDQRYWFVGTDSSLLTEKNRANVKDLVFVKIINLDKLAKIKITYAEFKKVFEQKSYGRSKYFGLPPEPKSGLVEDRIKINEMAYSNW